MKSIIAFFLRLFRKDKPVTDTVSKTTPVSPAHTGLKLAPRGIRNNNPGNINYVGQAGAVLETPLRGETARFARFVTPEAGLTAMRDQLQRYYTQRGLDTVKDIIETWAPPKENDTTSYYNGVAHALGVEPTDKLGALTPRILSGLMHSIIRIENGTDPYGHLVDTIAMGETPYKG